MAETIYNILKITIIVAVASAFAVAIYSLFATITTLVFGGIISESFALLSVFMPFNAGAVFSAIGMSCASILAFVIARKIFELTSWVVLDA